jgi:shikimate kinase
MNVVLIGYRGTGKTTVAVHLARRLGWESLDTDDEIESRAGRSIAEIFATAGEAAFRDLEQEVVLDLAARDRVVLALGGGAVLREKNRAALAAGGTLVWLKASRQTIENRLASDATTKIRRPNLTPAGGAREIDQLLREREPIYRECADLVIDTDDDSPEEIAEEILSQLPPAFSSPDSA